MPPSATATPLPAMRIRMDQTVPILPLPEHLDLKGLKAWLTDEMPNHLDVIGGRIARLDLGARRIQLLELRRVLHFLKEEWNIEITGLYLMPDVLHRYAERELRMKVFLHEIEEAAPEAPADLPEEAQSTELLDESEPVDPELLEAPPAPRLQKITLPNDLSEEILDEAPETGLRKPTHDDGTRRTLSIYRTIRSGNVVRFDGDVYLFGDVNPGAQIVATGNIVVMGALKGMAWAGAAGNENGVIVALQFRPTQLRIGRKIATAPDRESPSLSPPEMASILDDQIVIEPYTGKIRNQ